MISDTLRETANLLKILGPILTAAACSAAPETTTAKTSNNPMATSTSTATSSGEEVPIADDPEVMLDRYQAVVPLFEYDSGAPPEIEESDPVGSEPRRGPRGGIRGTFHHDRPSSSPTR